MDIKNREAEQQSLTPPPNAAIIAALFYAVVREKQLAVKVLQLQILVILAVTSVAAYAWEGSKQNAIAVLAGGCVSILNGAMLVWRMRRAAQDPNLGAHQQLRRMYFFAAERFSAVVVSLAICIAVLKLKPIETLIGFAMGQAVLMLARLFLKIKTEIVTKDNVKRSTNIS